MQAIEFETHLENGLIRLPVSHQHWQEGKHVKVIVLVDESIGDNADQQNRQSINRHAGKISLTQDPLDFQKKSEMNGHEFCFRYQYNTVFLAGRLAEPLPEADFYVSVITEIELLSYPLLKTEDEAEIRAFLNDITIIDLTENIKQSAIAFRRQYRLKLPDALIVATAYSLSAELFTNDNKLLGISELSVKSLLLKV